MCAHEDAARARRCARTRSWKTHAQPDWEHEWCTSAQLRPSTPTPPSQDAGFVSYLISTHLHSDGSHATTLDPKRSKTTHRASARSRSPPVCAFPLRRVLTVCSASGRGTQQQQRRSVFFVSRFAFGDIARFEREPTLSRPNNETGKFPLAAHTRARPEIRATRFPLYARRATTTRKRAPSLYVSIRATKINGCAWQMCESRSTGSAHI